MQNNKYLPIKLPPHNLDAEIAVLGACFLNKDARDIAISSLHPNNFYRDANANIFSAFLNCSENDHIAISDYLEKKDLLKKSGGVNYLLHIIEQVSVSAGINHWIEILKDLSIKRELIRFSSLISESSFNNHEQAKEIISTTYIRLDEIANNLNDKSDFKSIKESIIQSYKLLEERAKSESFITGLPTGFTDFDRLTSGLQKADLIIIAGRPSQGKTSIALNIASNIALNGGTVGLFSLEMSYTQLTIRLLGSDARIDAQKLRSGSLQDNEWVKISDSANKMSDLPIYINDCSSITTTDIKTKSAKLKKDKGLSLIVVDYLQLMNGKGESREREVANISKQLKQIAKDLDVPVVALSQLNRKCEERPNKRPRLSDLRESGSIEQDSDVICFIYRDEVYNGTNDDNKNIAEIIIGKQRNGPTGHFKLTFLKEITRFEDYIDDEYVQSDLYSGLIDFGPDLEL